MMLPCRKKLLGSNMLAGAGWFDWCYSSSKLAIGVNLSPEMDW